LSIHGQHISCIYVDNTTYIYYILIMDIVKFTLPRRILDKLSGKINDFYLAGGTALSMIYFQHRESYDVDLFTKNFSQYRVKQIVDCLKKDGSISIEETGFQLENNMAKMLTYDITFEDGSLCKLDFVEDFFDLLLPLQEFNGIKILSREDIYFRKISAVAGYIVKQNSIGRDTMVGGRQEAKDVYDLYCLSSISKPLSAFLKEYGNGTMIEAIIRWQQTYDRLQMKTGLLDLITPRDIDTREVARHFDNEVDQIIRGII